MRVSIVIPHYNQVDLLNLCLESLSEQTFPTEHYEIIVIDNATPGGIDDLYEKWPGVLFLTEHKRGAAAARNKGLEVAHGNIIAFIDSDCVATPQWLSHSVSTLESCKADMVGGRMNITCADMKQINAIERFEMIFAFRQKKYIAEKGFSVTANLTVTRKVADQVGAFRDCVAEDKDWCHRALALGFRLVFDGKAIVSHPARSSWAELTQKWDRLVSQDFALFRTNGNAMWRWHMRALVTGVSAFGHVPFVLMHNQGGGIGDRLAVIGHLIRLRLWRMWRMERLVLQGQYDSAVQG